MDGQETPIHAALNYPTLIVLGNHKVASHQRTIDFGPHTTRLLCVGLDATNEDQVPY